MGNTVECFAQVKEDKGDIKAIFHELEDVVKSWHVSCDCGFPRAKPPLGSREKLLISQVFKYHAVNMSFHDLADHWVYEISAALNDEDRAQIEQSVGEELYCQSPALVTRRGGDWSWSTLGNVFLVGMCFYRSSTAGCPQAVQISITVTGVEVASGKGHHKRHL